MQKSAKEFILNARNNLCDYLKERGSVVAEANEKLIEKIQMLRPIDDTFFEVLADDVEFCEEILQIIPQKKEKRILPKDT